MGVTHLMDTTIDCIICGELTCRCVKCRNGRSLQTRYGFCRSCANDLQVRTGGSTKKSNSPNGEGLFVRASRGPDVTRVEDQLKKWRNENDRRKNSTRAGESQATA